MVHNTLLVTGATPANAGVAVTRYWTLGNANLASAQTTEANSQISYRTAGTFSKLYVYINQNTSNSAATITVRKNGAAGNLTVSIPAGFVGAIEDTTHTDTVTAGDKFSYESVTAGTGSMEIAILSVIFTSTTNTVCRLVANGVAVVNFATASATRYVPLGGIIASNLTTESTTQVKMGKAASLKNLAVYVAANARTTNTVVRTRKNAAAGACSITITSTATGLFEDTTNSDTLAVDDLCNFAVVTLTGTENVQIDSIAVDFISTALNGLLITARGGALVQNTSVTNYLQLAGNLVAGTIEAERQTKAREQFTLSRLSLNVSANTITANSTLTLRKNASAGNQIITVGSSATGFFEDTTHSDIITPTDLINYEVITGASGTALTYRNVSVSTLAHASIIKAATETLTISEPSMIRISGKPRSSAPETITISETRNRVNGAVRAIAAQTVAIAEDLDSIITAVGAVIQKTITNSITISEASIARLKAVWRYQP